MTCLSLPDLINLSFDDCEHRHIKFRVLQYSLQVIIQQLGLSKVIVEFRGDDSDFIENEVHKSTEEIRKKILWDVAAKHKGKLRSAKKSQDPCEPEEQRNEKVVVIEHGQVLQDNFSSKLVTIRLKNAEERIRILQTEVDHLGARTLPTNEELLHQLKNDQESKPVTELLDTLKIAKRMSGAEEGIDKIGSLLETVTKEYNKLRTVMDKIEQEFGQDVNETLDQLHLVSQYLSNVRPKKVFYQTVLNKRLRERTDSIDYDKEEDRSAYDDELPEPISIKSKTFLADKEKFRKSYSINDDIGPDAEPERESEVLLPPSISLDNFEEDRSEHIDHPEVQRKERSTALMSEASKPQQNEGSKAQINGESTEVKGPISENIEFPVIELNKLIQQHEQLKVDNEFITVQLNTLSHFAEVILCELTENRPNLEILKEKLREIRLSPSEYKKTKSWKRNILDIHRQICYRIDNIEGNVSKYAGTLVLQDEMRKEMIDAIEERIDSLETELHSAIADLEELKLRSEEEDTKQVLETLGLKLATMEEDLNDMDARTLESSRDVKSQDMILRRLKDEISKLTTLKLDRFELEELLTDKASIQELNKKLSHDEYKLSYRYLTKCIERNADKLSAQIIFWEKAIQHFKRAIEKKLSLEEFNGIVETLITEVKKIAKNETLLIIGLHGPPARGAKDSLKHQQCISCDREVTIKKENDYPILPLLPKLPGHKLKSRREFDEEKDLFMRPVAVPSKISVAARSEISQVEMSETSITSAVTSSVEALHFPSTLEEF